MSIFAPKIKYNSSAGGEPDVSFFLYDTNLRIDVSLQIMQVISAHNTIKGHGNTLVNHLQFTYVYLSTKCVSNLNYQRVTHFYLSGLFLEDVS
jgi:hypothetical protein